MADLVLHEATAKAIERFVRHPNHGLIIVGAAGIGKSSITKLLIAQLLDITTEAVERYPYLQSLTPPADKSSISIEAVRELQQFAKLKLPGSKNSQRLLVIEDAHTMTTEAQNALLKLLEEPPLDTTIIMTVADEDALLTTIRSRAQRLQVHRPKRDQVTSHFNDAGFSEKDIQQTYMLSGGLPGLQHSLLHNDEHPLKAAVNTARSIVQADTFQRLCLVDDLAKKKPECLQLLFVLQHMAQTAIEQAGQRTDADPEAIRKRLKQWHKVHKAAYEAERALRQNAQAKLVLDNLMLAL